MWSASLRNIQKKKKIELRYIKQSVVGYFVEYRVKRNITENVR